VFKTSYIIETLADHESFEYTGMKIHVPDAHNRPRGALMLVLAAVIPAFVSSVTAPLMFSKVERALQQWESGCSDGIALGAFNKSTWGTADKANANTAAIDGLLDNKWDSIVKAVYGFKNPVHRGTAKKTKPQATRATLRACKAHGL
jgi:hypothetical protein